mmetsp:Transcript_61185/g.124150  ORF Transcript_61185/g.124150 Transcript_61185/m.124150 type:complete len:212 (-) Transcript_61185:256-891(-)
MGASWPCGRTLMAVSSLRGSVRLTRAVRWPRESGRSSSSGGSGSTPSINSACSCVLGGSITTRLGSCVSGCATSASGCTSAPSPRRASACNLSSSVTRCSMRPMCARMFCSVTSVSSPMTCRTSGVSQPVASNSALTLDLSCSTVDLAMSTRFVYSSSLAAAALSWSSTPWMCIVRDVSHASPAARYFSLSARIAIIWSSNFSISALTSFT